MKGQFFVGEEEIMQRLDKVCENVLAGLTRSHIKTLIDEGKITVNGKKVKAGEKLKKGWLVEYNFEDAKPLEVKPENIDFEIVYEDKDLLVINKPQGLVVHPCSSTKSGTLVNGLLAKVHDLSGINGILRPGIVHRLDKNTSGLMLVAKSDLAHKSLAEQIKNKTCKREYIALCDGYFEKDSDTITTFIERSKKDRKKMTVSSSGKEAITHYEVLERFNGLSLVRFSLKTGRTHQIRVHCKMLGHSIVGDDVYGKAEKGLNGQLLHSQKITFVHPRTQEILSFEADLPCYFKEYIEKKKHRSR